MHTHTHTFTLIPTSTVTDTHTHSLSPSPLPMHTLTDIHIDHTLTGNQVMKDDLTTLLTYIEINSTIWYVVISEHNTHLATIGTHTLCAYTSTNVYWRGSKRYDNCPMKTEGFTNSLYLLCHGLHYNLVQVQGTCVYT